MLRPNPYHACSNLCLYRITILVFIAWVNVHGVVEFHECELCRGFLGISCEITPREVESVVILHGQLHDLHKKPMKLYPRFIYGETQTIEDYMLRFPNKFSSGIGFN